MMLSRFSAGAALALILPVAGVLLIAAILARPGIFSLAASGAQTDTPAPAGPPAPELTGGGNWINSAPLTLAGLQAERKVVLIDFWTYGCYNCQNTLPA